MTNIFPKTLIFLWLNIIFIKVNAQSNSDAFKYFLENNQTEIKYPAGVNEFYRNNGFNISWLTVKNETSRKDLLLLLRNAADIGLEEKGYQYSFINAYSTGKIILKTETDSFNTEIRLTDAALHFFNDVAYGNVAPSLGYNGLKFDPGCHNIPGLLLKYITEENLPSLIQYLSAGLPEIEIISYKISQLRKVIAANAFREETVGDKKISNSNRPLITRLHQLGMLDSDSSPTNDSTLKQSIKNVQCLFNLMSDGIIRSTLLDEINIPLSVRLTQLKVSLNSYRWLNCFIKNNKVIVVNIPAAFLKVYQDTNIILDMKVIVGKPSTPTPTLLSSVDEVVLYPFWYVPHSIATKELLQLIKKDRGFLDKGNYQVLNLQGKLVDPTSVKWRKLGKNHFPFIIRQSTGCDNSLGLLKLNFYNPFGVYLHDTPNSTLFKMNKRYFSHGCMRMEKPFEIGRLVLKNNTVAIDTLYQKECLINQPPIVIPAGEKIPVLVWYNPVEIDAEGKLVFYEDVYGKFLKKK